MALLNVGTVDIRLGQLDTPVGIQLQSVTVRAAEVKLDEESGRLSGVNPAAISATILGEAIQSFLETESPGGLQRFFVECLDGRLRVRATRRMLIEIPVCAVCTLRIEDGKSVFVDVESVEVLQVNLDNFVRTQIEKVNPIFTVDMLPLAATLKSVQIDSSGITIFAEAPVNFRI